MIFCLSFELLTGAGVQPSSCIMDVHLVTIAAAAAAIERICGPGGPLGGLGAGGGTPSAPSAACELSGSTEFTEDRREMENTEGAKRSNRGFSRGGGLTPRRVPRIGFVAVVPCSVRFWRRSLPAASVAGTRRKVYQSSKSSRNSESDGGCCGRVAAGAHADGGTDGSLRMHIWSRKLSVLVRPRCVLTRAFGGRSEEP
ncbi:hypothetical protein L226DRAFT_43801 [Lentinus tigrinus ALCF2SS1-7]|uniref:uncharacterized protein n=1 Tax=Lentinus tigrinus ALCF2SS1-7 TaxID=1328758 RepID=UPI001165E23E|nr:hypothetical protein L226DRAFT_43801 [Lentinus tigrinus ALCF2SS1-7]